MQTMRERRSARSLLEAQIHEPFIRLSNEVRELGGVHLDRLSSVPDSLTFYRDYVSTNRPCLIDGAADDWPALTKWNDNQYLIDRMANQSISVSCTPDGMADSINQSINRFVMPCDEQWPFEKFLRECTNQDTRSLDEQKQAEHDKSTNQSTNQSINQSIKPPRSVVYAQHQNSSLDTEFSPLSSDIRPLSWAISAFGCDPEATNMWIGNSQSITSPHMDHYENIYTVITGVKRFLLWPPQDCYFMNRRRVKQARWVRNPAFNESVNRTINQSNSQSSNQSTNPPEFILQVDDDMPNIPWPDLDARKEWFVHASQDEIDDMFNQIKEQQVEQPIEQTTEQSPEQSTEQSINQSTEQISDLDYIPFHPIDDRLRHQHAPPLCVTVRAGQTLFLPSMWFHAVLQGEDEQGKTMAVNSWFDMKFDSKFAYFQFMSERIDEAYQELEDIEEQYTKKEEEEEQGESND